MKPQQYAYRLGKEKQTETHAQAFNIQKYKILSSSFGLCYILIFVPGISIS